MYFLKNLPTNTVQRWGVEHLKAGKLPPNSRRGKERPLQRKNKQALERCLFHGFYSVPLIFFVHNTDLLVFHIHPPPSIIAREALSGLGR